jgi:mono/diheme cytochrome c family protein
MKDRFAFGSIAAFFCLLMSFALMSAGNPVQAASSAGDADHGKKVFSQNCSSCHSTTRQGGVEPGLKGEKFRKNFVQVVDLIKNPPPPMTKLYPSVLSTKDVNDVAAYVESL